MATRRERVVIELEDGLTAGVLREAAAVAVLNRELDKLSRDSVKAKQGMDPLGRETIPQTTRNSDAAGKSIDKLSGRLELFARSIAAIGPATIPIGAVAIPAVTTLASGLGFLTVGAGTTILAFHGLGDALTKFNKAAAEPTATNIAAAQAAMDKIAPSAQNFVLELHRLGPELERLQQAAGSGLFPGLTKGIKEAQSALPAVERIFRLVGSEMGNLSAEAGKSLGGPEWAPFLKFIGDEAPHALSQMGHAMGSVTHGLAELWMATQPLNSGGLDWIEKAANGFDSWATGLDQTQGFKDFVAYIQQHGPEVEQLLADTSSLFVDIVQAAAPLGGPTLHALDLIVKALDLLANSPIATPLLALIQLNSVLRLTSTGLQKIGVDANLGLTKGLTGSLKGATSGLYSMVSGTTDAKHASKDMADQQASTGVEVAKGAGQLAAFALVSSGAADAMGIQNTAMLGLAGSMAGPFGAAVGIGVGALLDFKSASQKAGAAQSALDSTMSSSTSTITQQTDALTAGQVALDSQVANLKKHSGVLGAAQQVLVHPFASINYGLSGLDGSSTIQDLRVSLDSARSDLADTQTALGALFTQLGGQSHDKFGRDLVLTVQQLQGVATRAEPAMQALGITTNDLQQAAARGDGSLDKLTGRIVDWINTADSAKGRSQAMADALAKLGDESLTSADRVKGLEDALDGLFNPKMSLNATHNAWHEALSGLKDSLFDVEALKSAQVSAHSAQISYNEAVKNYGKNSAKAHLAAERLAIAQQKVRDAAAGSSRAILGNSDAALKNQDAIRGLAGNLIDYLKAQAEAGKPASQIMATYRTQRQALIDTATQMGINKKDLEAYLKIIGFTPKAVTTVIKTRGVPQSLSDLRSVASELAKLRDKTIHIATVRTTGGRVLPGMADGGTVAGAPRRPYADKVIIAAAPGEEIISNRHGQADQFRADRAAGRIPAYADGGKVARSYQRPDVAPPLMMQSRGQATPSIDYGRLTRALLAARPLYGDLHMQPHNYGEFQRQMQQDHAMAVVGGGYEHD